MKLPNDCYTIDVVKASALRLDKPGVRVLGKFLAHRLLRYAVMQEVEVRELRKEIAALRAQINEMRKGEAHV